MKISNIAQKCKETKSAYIIDCRSYQFIGNGHAMYKAAGLPEINPENIPALFGLSQKDWIDNWTSRRVPQTAVGISFDDFNESDELAEQPYTSIVLNGEVIRCFIGNRSKEMIFVKGWYIENLSSDETEYYMRRTHGGKPVLAVKAGLLTEAIIYPMSVFPKKLSDRMFDFAGAIATQCRSYEHVEDATQITINDQGDAEAYAEEGEKE